jgi:hypothetical protein
MLLANTCTHPAIATFEHLNLKATSSLGFLYPALVNLGYNLPRKPRQPCAFVHRPQKRILQSSTRIGPGQIRHDSVYKVTRLPRQCSGCGAFSQTSNDKEAGFYSLSRKSVRAFLGAFRKPSIINSLAEGEIIETLQNVDKETVEALTAHASAPLCELRLFPTPIN